MATTSSELGHLVIGQQLGKIIKNNMFAKTETTCEAKVVRNKAARSMEMARKEKAIAPRSIITTKINKTKINFSKQ